MHKSHIKETAGIYPLCDLVRETSYSLPTYLRGGHLEKIYENGLVHRLRKAGCHVQQQAPIRIRDEDGYILGDYLADLIIHEVLIAELKACRALAP